MIRLIKKSIMIIMLMLLSLGLLDKTTYAEENTINNIAVKQEKQAAISNYYVNEPLDNSLPVIYKYEIEGDGYITPGKEFTIKFTVYNPAVVTKLGNINIVVTDDKNLVYPKYGSTNSIYIGYLDVLSYQEQELTLMASKDIKDKEIVVKLVLIFLLFL